MSDTHTIQTPREPVNLTSPVEDGYMVVHIGYGIIQPAHPSGYFSVTADIYSSKRAYDLGNTSAIHSGGCMHEEILKVFPQLVPLVALHGADVETGEPSHAVANGWYWYQGYRPWRIVNSDRYHGGNATIIYPYQLADWCLEDSDEGRRQYCYLAACRALRVDSIPMHDVETRADFEAFADKQRERWAREAQRARELIESLRSESVSVPADDDENRVRWSHVFDGDLRVSAEFDGSSHDNVGGHFIYKVHVSAPRDGLGTERASYRTVFTGSTADYEADRIDAREAAMHTLSELVDFLDRSADEMVEDMGLEDEPKTVRVLRRAEAFVDKVSETFEINREVFA